MVILHALGQCLVRTALTTISPRADMCFALSAYLARERGKRVPRKLLEGLFWPGIHSADASHSLSELIHKLRRKGVPIQRDSAACIWLPREAIGVDVDHLDAEPPASLAERDLSILPGYSPQASAAFNDWLDDWRNHLQLRVLDQVIAATDRAFSESDWPTTLALAEQALRIDPENEHARNARAAATRLVVRREPWAQYIDPTRQLRSGMTRIREPRANAASTNARIVNSPVSKGLVGREAQLEILTRHAEDVSAGAVRATYLFGPAGFGKTALATAAAGQVGKAGAAVLALVCEGHDRDHPLSLLTRLVPGLRTLPGAAGAHPASLDCLARFEHLANDGPDPRAGDTVSAKPASIRHAVLDLLEAISEEQPLVLLVENTHWLDHESWSLLRFIASAARNSLWIICTTRLNWQHRSWGDPEPFALVPVPALDEAPTRAIVVRHIERSGKPATAQIIDWCVTASAGNPYFIEELVWHWANTGEILAAPPKLMDLVQSRLAGLAQKPLNVIQAAAILGTASTIDMLQRVLEIRTSELFEALEDLADAALIDGTAITDDACRSTVLCRNELIIAAAKRMLSVHAKQLLHYAAAKAIESHALASESPELLWACADHWKQAGQPRRATGAALACAQHLFDVGLIEEAADKARDALQHATTSTCSAAALRIIGTAQYTSRRWDEFTATVRSVRAIETALDSTSRIHDDLELCDLNAQRYCARDFRVTLGQARECVHSLAAGPRHRVLAAISALKLATNLGETAAMHEIFTHASPLSSDPSVSIVDRLTLPMIYHTICGDPGIAATSARDLAGYVLVSVPPRHQFVALIDCAGTLRRVGTQGEAVTLYTRIFDTAMQLQCTDVAADVAQRCIETCADEGDIDLAREWINRYQQLRRPRSEMRAHRALQLVLLRVCIAERRWQDAEKLLTQHRRQPLWEDSVPMFRGCAIAARLRLELGRGASHETIEPLVSELAAISGSLRATGAQDFETFALYLGYRFLGRTAEAIALLTSYVECDRRDTTCLPAEIREALRTEGYACDASRSFGTS